MKQLRQYIRHMLTTEAVDPIRVKTIAPDDFDPPVWSDAQEPRSSETPIKKVGSFFMTKENEKLPKGYGALKKYRKFYMILPDGEAIRIGPFAGEPKITKNSEGFRYLQALDTAVTVLSISDVYTPSPKDMENMLAMQDQIITIARRFI